MNAYLCVACGAQAAGDLPPDDCDACNARRSLVDVADAEPGTAAGDGFAQFEVRDDVVSFVVPRVLVDEPDELRRLVAEQLVDDVMSSRSTRIRRSPRVSRRSHRVDAFGFDIVPE